MKRYFFIVAMLLISAQAFTQENIAILGGGYSFATIEDTEIKTTGWRIGGVYEFNPSGGSFAHGFGFGYISLSATEGTGSGATDYKINSFPIYYAPKYMFGKEKLKLFIKGVVGMQFSGLKREGFLNLSDNDFGFYGGGGAGAMIFVRENIFINVEYEIAWASNSYYKDGWINTAGGGIGMKF